MTLTVRINSRPRAPSLFSGSYVGVVAMLVCTATPLLAYLGNLGFAPLVALGGMACLPAALKRRSSPIGFALLSSLLIWALVSLAWSPAAPHAFDSYRRLEQFTGLKLVFELTLYGAFVVAMRDVEPRAARMALLIMGFGLMLAMLLVLIEATRGAPLYQAIKAAAHEYTRPDLARRNVARATYAAVLLVWPAALVLSEGRWSLVVVALVATTLVSALILNVDAPVAAIVVASACFLLVRYGRRGGVWLLSGAIVVYFAAAPVAISLVERVTSAAGEAVGKLSWGARLDVWRFVVDRIAEHPIRGWGLDASRIFPGVVPLHPHDAALQIWLELGAPGAILAALFFGWLVAQIAALRTHDPLLSACAAASLGAYLTIGALSFGVWQEWWLALGALTTASLCLASLARRDTDTRQVAGLRPLDATPASLAGLAEV